MSFRMIVNEVFKTFRKGDFLIVRVEADYLASIGGFTKGLCTE